MAGSLTTINISSEYGYVLIAAGILVLEGFYLGGRVMSVRKQVFKSDEFLKNAKGLLEQHKKDFPYSKFVSGYPDMGSGMYSQKLTYAQWFLFNNAQRGHLNYLETVWAVFGMLLVGGFFKPVLFASLTGVYIVGRFLYAVGYSSTKGPSGREAGAILGMLSVLAMVGNFIYLGVTLLKK